MNSEIKVVKCKETKTPNLKSNNRTKKICCICGKDFEGYGNNPWPIEPKHTSSNTSDSSQCCNKCNCTVVLKARLRRMMNIIDSQPC